MKKTVWLLILILILTVSCGKDKVKPSEDSLQATEAITIMNAVKEAYQDKNEPVLKNHIGSSLAANIIKYLYFETARLDFTTRLVKLTDESVSININWQGKWTFAEDKTVSKSGVGKFVFHKETMKLIYIDGDNPFLTPAIRN